MKKQTLSWIVLFVITFLAAYLYIFNEWLFAATKPYYMNDLSFLRQLQIYFTVSALMAALPFIGLLFLFLLSLLPPLKRYTDDLIKLGTLLPTAIFGSLILIMADNFTYTVFKWGIVSTDGLARGLYGLAFIVAMFLCYRLTLKTLTRWSQQNSIWRFTPNRTFGTLATVLLLSLITLTLSHQSRVPSLGIDSGTGAEQYPHILLITADGVNATHVSLYGYERDTTPHLRELADSALVAENAFSNSGNSPGSVISMYTSKHPAKTRVLYPPDILKGPDAYEHLPGILRFQGYKTVQIAVPYYIEAKTLNVLDGFDEIKMTDAMPSQLLTRIGRFLPSDHALFIDETIQRFLDRIRHIFFIKKMEDPYRDLTGTDARRVDMERWVYLRKEIQIATQPLFVHLHLMVTHGDKFYPMEQTFSAGQSMEEQEPWSADFYDDAILDFDTNVGRLVDQLTESGLLDNTLLIIGSDHGEHWDQLQRVPLLIRFPHAQYAGRIQANVQNLDIAPTILDYIGVDQPDWMRGTSLMTGALEQRPIFGVNDVEKEMQDEDGVFAVNWDKVSPPFYQFGGISLIYCQKWFRLDLANLAWEMGNVEGSTSVCSLSSEITDEQAFQLIVEHLRQNSFDVSSLESMKPWNQ